VVLCWLFGFLVEVIRELQFEKWTPRRC